MANYFSNKSLFTLKICSNQVRVDSRILALVMEIKHETLIKIIKSVESELKSLGTFQWIRREDSQKEVTDLYPFTYLSETQAKVLLSSYFNFIITVKSQLNQAFREAEAPSSIEIQ